MEFDNNTQPTETTDAKARQLAESKKLTLQPIHNDVTPEDDPDTQVVAQHLVGPAIGNIPTDTEQSAPIIQPSPGLLHQEGSGSKKSHYRVILIALATGGICAMGTTVFFMLTS